MRDGCAYRGKKSMPVKMQNGLLFRISNFVSCMIAFRMMGEDRKNSSVLSLYLGMPIILISFLSNLADLEEIKFDFNLLIIFVVTFVFAYLTLKLFINFINNIGFKPFVIYRLIFGLLILTLLG